MRAITIPQPGGPDALVLADVPVPDIGAGDVLVQVVAAGINRADIGQRAGRYPAPAGASPYPGLECAGRVVAVGREVVDWQVGDEVCALLSGGGYAEFVAVPAGQLLPVLPQLTLFEAAALPEVLCTVWYNVFTCAGLRPGELLLVHGGAGGIGTAAVQLARAHGARVAVTAGSPEKLARCADLGAEILINYHQRDFVAAMREATDGRGADVVLDVMGAQYFARNLDALAVVGRLVIIGMQGVGDPTDLNLAALIYKRLTVMGSALRPRSIADKAAIVASVREHVWPQVAAGAVRPIVQAQYPLEQADRAHRAFERGEHIGKIVLTMEAS